MNWTGDTYNLYRYNEFNTTTNTINNGKPLLDAYVWEYDNTFSQNVNYSAYTQVTDIVELEQTGIWMLYDYQQRRRAITAFHYRKGWNNLTNDEKDIVIDWHAHPNTTVTGTTQDTEKVIHLMTTKGYSLQQAQGYLLDVWHKNWKLFKDDCPSRWAETIKVVAKYLTLADASDLSNTVESLKMQYLSDGRLGITYGDSQNGIMNYIDSTYMFENDGLEHNLYNLRYGTWEDFKDELIDWLVCTFFWDEIVANRPTN